MKRQTNDRTLTKQDLLDALAAQEERILTVTKQNLVEAMQAQEERILAVTRQDLQDALTNVATKDDLKAFTTKEDLKSFARKDDLKSFATKDDLVNFATKDDLAAFATKDDITGVIEVIQDLSGHIDARFNVLEKDVAGLKKDTKRIEDKLDAAILQNNVQDGQLARHERWHYQVAQKLNVNLT